MINAANVGVESYWPSLFAKLAEKRNLDDLILNAGSGGCAAPAAVAAPSGGAAASAPAAAAAEEKKKVRVWFQIVSFYRGLLLRLFSCDVDSIFLTCCE